MNLAQVIQRPALQNANGVMQARPDGQPPSSAPPVQVKPYNFNP